MAKGNEKAKVTEKAKEMDCRLWDRRLRLRLPTFSQAVGKMTTMRSHTRQKRATTTGMINGTIGKELAHKKIQTKSLHSYEV